ncbi:MAG: SUF system Fe-S cluster assembly regulator [Gammaproteobacteria bacterium]|nr:SUF system Fe-S cluster assembly regulator [Gammaproteobacteria bacterium]
MLRISNLADYATILMDFLAQHNDSTYSATVLAEVTKIPLPAVGKTLKLLCKAKLLASERGTNGGYRLNQMAEDISLAAIILAIDGRPALTQCSQDAKVCGFEHSCSLKGNWQLINKVIIEALGNVTLADMGRQLTAKDIPIKFYSKRVRQNSKGAANESE